MLPHRARGAWLVAVVALMSAVTFAGLAAPSSTADTVSDRKQKLDREIAELRESLEGTNEDLVEAAVALKKSEARLDDAQESLASAQAALADAKRRDAEIAARLAVAKADEAKSARQLATGQAREQATRVTLGRIARETYLTSGMSELAIALEAESPQQFADRVSIAGAALRAQNSAIETLRVVQAETRARQARLRAVRAEVADLKRESAALLKVRRAAEAKAAAAETEMAEVVDLRSGALATIKERKAAEQERIAGMEKEAARLRAILAARAKDDGGGGGAAGQPASGAFSYPVNAPVTSGFGMRYHPVLHYWRLHAGTDFGAGCGTPVRAASSGTVIRAGWAGGYGNQIVVAHGRIRGTSLASSYNHLSRIAVGGGRVDRGQVIGYVGTTGLSTGCHLHFEVYENGTPVDPMRWL